MDALPEDWQAVPNEKEKCEEITRLTVDMAPQLLDWLFCLHCPIASVFYGAVGLRLSNLEDEALCECCRFLKISVILTEPLHCYWVATHSSKKASLIGDTQMMTALMLHVANTSQVMSFAAFQHWCEPKAELPFLLSGTPYVYFCRHSSSLKRYASDDTLIPNQRFLGAFVDAVLLNCCRLLLLRL